MRIRFRQGVGVLVHAEIVVRKSLHSNGCVASVAHGWTQNTLLEKRRAL
jgi:hypothetical protein